MTIASASPPTLLPVLFLALLAVPLAIIDLRTSRLPNVLTLPSFPIALALLIHTLPAALLGACALTSFHLLVRTIHPPAIGWGDIKLSPTLGLYLGTAGPLALLLAPLIASCITLALCLTRNPTWRTRIPHAPGLLTATLALSLTPL
ncbi:prepilin peptidase [Actinokineospora inagensis]|uniref:prepilin peptidase n=1 Tax=Actinokineospora inagensis TaxID=103730 RepID=UPI00068409C3|nr:A24 family peptidase [Actinokineospora inagensis]